MTEQRPLKGIIQTRGLGDVMIALPIARHYWEQGLQPVWPILSHWVEQMRHYAPWVEWIPIEQDHGPFFYDKPKFMLEHRGIKDIICFYNALTNHKFHEVEYFQHNKFDQFKYVHAGVPFLKKWTLSNCIQRDSQREHALYQKVVGTDTRPYVLCHLKSSEQTVRIPADLIPKEYRRIDITDQGWVLDWLGVIQNASAVVMTNSVFVNVTDQMGFDLERYYIPQHHIQLTPVFGQTWIWLENPDLDPRLNIFAIK